MSPSSESFHLLLRPQSLSLSLTHTHTHKSARAEIASLNLGSTFPQKTFVLTYDGDTQQAHFVLPDYESRTGRDRQQPSLNSYSQVGLP